MNEKPAESAAAYLAAQDMIVYNNRKRAEAVLKEGGFGHPALWIELDRGAQKQYRQAEKHAAQFWGTSEIRDVRNAPRAWGDNTGHIGSFFT